MVKLLAKSPCDGLLPIEAGGVRLTEVEAGTITSIMPYDGQEAALSAALKSLTGLDVPAPNRAISATGGRIVWSGAGQAFLIGFEADPSLARHAALTDQSDAWAVMRIKGAPVRDVLARLIPIDLNPGVFKPLHAARTLLGHMNCLLIRVDWDAFEILIFRSMAGSAVHELEEVMRAVAARNAL